MDLLSRIPESAPVKQAWRAFASQDGFSQIKQLFAVEALVDGAMWDVFAHAFFAGAARAAEEAGSVWEPQLDAARAETEAVRSLAADLVEGLAHAKRRFQFLAAHDDTMRNGVRPSVGALEAEDAIARARALGIGEEKNATKDGRTE